MVEPSAAAAAAAAAIATVTGTPRHDLAVVLGSGWAPAADLLGETVAEVDLRDLPGFAPAAVPGHVGTVRSVLVAGSGRRALVFGTRTHLYEGRGVRAVAHGVRTAAAAGCSVVVLTNAAGSLRPQWPPGTPVLVADHVNLTGRSPIEGPHFADLGDLYAARLRAFARQVAPDLAEGVYVQLPGPHYETPAEIAMVRAIGGDLVGMSTALEAIAAREAGLEVLALSLVTNLAAGVGHERLDHADVLAAAAGAADRVGALLAQVIRLL